MSSLLAHADYGIVKQSVYLNFDRQVPPIENSLDCNFFFSNLHKNVSLFLCCVTLAQVCYKTAIMLHLGEGDSMCTCHLHDLLK